MTRSRLSRRWLLLLLGALASAPRTAPAREPQSPGSPDRPAQPTPPSDEPRATPSPAELVEELLTAGDGDDDLEWLYSDAEEYEASPGLVGRPVPADAFPSRGEGSRRTWEPEDRRFSLGNYILTGAAIAIGAASALIPPTPDRFRHRNDVDEWGRRHLGINDYERSRWAQDTSDVLLSIAVTYPLLVDSMIVMYWYRQSPEVAKQMALISAEAIAVPSALQSPVAGFASRERPYGRDCGSEIPSELDDCSEKKRYRSFFSGHTTLSFAGASVSCFHHLHHRVYGDPVADGLSCGGGLAVATATGLLRIVGDQHYVTDVALGALVGTLGGFGVPWLLHYGSPEQNADPRTGTPAVNLRLIARPDGLAVGGEF